PSRHAGHDVGELLVAGVRVVAPDWLRGRPRSSGMRRLSGLDTAFLYLETPTTHMTVQAVMLLDPSTVPGGYSFEKIKAHLASRLPLLPEFPRRLGARARARSPRARAPPRVGAFRPPPAGVVRRPRLRLRLPRAAHRGAVPGHRQASRRHRG